jgi:hypothetical protein
LSNSIHESKVFGAVHEIYYVPEEEGFLRNSLGPGRGKNHAASHILHFKVVIITFGSDFVDW